MKINLITFECAEVQAKIPSIRIAFIIFFTVKILHR